MPEENGNGNAAHPDVLDKSYHLMATMMASASGTFSHARAVAGLLDSLGAALGMDTVRLRLLRIAGYYHDIGKTVSPQLFTENQADGHNPHKELEPWVSHLLIMAHVGHTASILTNDDNIPREVVQWCSQHHGTSVMRYFLVKSGSENTDRFRYAATRPQSMEAALLMICDIIEAAARSKSQSGKLGAIDKFVDGVVDSLIKDTQLDDVILRVGDLGIVRRVLKREMESMYHDRIDYDDAKKERDSKGEGREGGEGGDTPKTEEEVDSQPE